MPVYEDITAEVEELGRLSDEQELTLYNIALKQDELGREASNLPLDKVKGNPFYEEMIAREYLTYELFNHGSKYQIASLYVTLKGTRYCIQFGDEISRRRPLNPAGSAWTI